MEAGLYEVLRRSEGQEVDSAKFSLPEVVNRLISTPSMHFTLKHFNMPVQPSEADIIFNRASVALAKSQRLIASWLPPKTPEELANIKSEEELENEEKEIFTPVPEL